MISHNSFFRFIGASCFFLSFGLASPLWAATPQAPFRFHIAGEPSSLSPVDSDNTESDYLFSNLYRGLFFYDNNEGVRPEGAKSCTRTTPLRFVCQLNKNVKWSDGVPVKAPDYVRAFQALFRPGRPARDIVILSNLKNAAEILAQKKLPSTLGIHADKDFELEFDFVRPDFEFETKLTSAALIPWREEPSRANWKDNHYNGPYQISDWIAGKKIILAPNTYYGNAKENHPNVEVLVVSDDAAALNLYETGGLDFLRRLPSALINAYRTHADFFLTPLDRFDYVGFGPELENQPYLRKALTLGADYNQFAVAFHSLGRPGCIGISLQLLDHDHCFDFNLAEAKKAFAKVSPEVQKRPISFYYSQAGGDDLRRVGEWYQAQWKKNLNYAIHLETREPKTYLALIGQNPPALFRKGFSLGRPACQAAVEAFVQKSPNNFIRQNSPAYESLFKRLEAEPNLHRQKKICGQLIDELMVHYRLIPQGRIHFPMLQNGHFAGWTVNALNQLDLAHLQATPSSHSSNP